MVRSGATGVLAVAALVVALGGAVAAAAPTSAAAPPTVKNVHARSLGTSRGTASWVITARAFDADRDLVGGRVQLKIGTKVLSRRIAGVKARATSAVPTAAGITSARLTGTTLRVGFFVRAAPGPLKVTFTVKDAHGHRARQITLALVVRGRAGGGGGGVTVSVAATKQASEPAAAGTFTITRTGSTAAALTVSYSVGGTATASRDYAALPGTVTIPARAASATVIVAPIDDTVNESAETVVLTLVAKSGYALGSTRSATVTIADDDTVAATTVTILATDSSAAEPTPVNTGTFTVTRTGSTTAALVVSYAASGTATAGSDYSALPGSVTIPAGASSATITVTPLADTLTETSETVVVTLSPGTGYTVGTPSSATVFISDSAPVTTVTVSATDSAAAEPADPGTFTVTRTGSTTSSLTVFYTVSGTATPDADYTTLSGSVTIPAGAVSATITVTPKDDTTVEVSESVVVTLSAGTGYTVGLFSVATVFIADNDTGATVTIQKTDDAAEPSDTGTFTVSRTGSTSAALDVSYAVSGTATAGTDYTTLSGTVTIASGQSSATITVSPIDDMTAEGDETVIVTLSADPDYTIGSPSSATMTIADNDSATLPTVTIEATDNHAGESGDPGEFTITRTGSTTSALTVFYTPSGTATNGSDYTALSGSVTIAAGQTTATITVAPIDDSVPNEGIETVILTLSSNASYSVGTPSSATVSIADND
jgi:hypothetical protein